MTWIAVAQDKSSDSSHPAFLGDSFVVKGTRAKGSGTYGTVYMVQEKTTFRIYAAKVECVSTTLESEVRFLEQFKHPGLLPIPQKHITQSGFSYFITSYIEQSLSSFLRSDGPLNDDCQQALFQQLMNVLAYIHSKSVLHADIKPANIMIDPPKQHFFLIDFGLATTLPLPAERKRDTWFGLIALILHCGNDLCVV